MDAPAAPVRCRGIALTLMNKIRHAIVLVVLAASTMSAASTPFDDHVLLGEWGTVESHWFRSDWFQYLKINNDFSGVFSYSFNGEPLVFHFDPGDIKHEDGLILITLRRGKGSPFRLALSGWRLGSGSALTTGALYMYIEEQGHEVLFNSIPLALRPLKAVKDGKDVPSVQSLKERLAE